MKYNKIEKLLQNKMEELEVSLPAEVWGTIEAKLKRKRFLRFFWFFFRFRHYKFHRSYDYFFFININNVQERN